MSSIFIAFIVAAVLSIHGLRKKSLSKAGASCAFLVGFCMFAGPLRAFGVSLIVFYLVGSRATKFGKQRKAQLEDGHHEAGHRNAWQVLCNSLTASLACLVWNALFVPGSITSTLASQVHPFETFPFNEGEWCPLSKGIAHGWSRGLLFAALGHFACCLGDTLASELGILSKHRPILITTFKAVPPGTNGALSGLGTLASVCGGAVMGLTLAVDLVLENVKCRELWVELCGPLVLYGCFAGFLGSLLDSLMGATLQRTRYSLSSKLILQDDSKVTTGSDVKVISGMNILTNNQVNLISSVITAVIIGFVGYSW